MRDPSVKSCLFFWWLLFLNQLTEEQPQPEHNPFFTLGSLMQ
jgi:hypothetical protein